MHAWVGDLMVDEGDRHYDRSGHRHDRQTEDYDREVGRGWHVLRPWKKWSCINECVGENYWRIGCLVKKDLEVLEGKAERVGKQRYHACNTGNFHQQKKENDNDCQEGHIGIPG